jgi:hypothetical protein
MMGRWDRWPNRKTEAKAKASMKEMRITRARMEHVLVDRSDGWVKLYRDIDLIEQDRKRRKVQRRDVFKTKRDETRQGKCGGGSWTHGDRSITDRVKSRETKGDSKKKLAGYATTNFVFQVAPKVESKRRKKMDERRRTQFAGVGKRE